MREAEETIGPVSPLAADQVAPLVGMAFLSGESLLLLGEPEWADTVRTTPRRIRGHTCIGRTARRSWYQCTVRAGAGEPAVSMSAVRRLLSHQPGMTAREIAQHLDRSGSEVEARVQEVLSSANDEFVARGAPARWRLRRSAVPYHSPGRPPGARGGVVARPVPRAGRVELGPYTWTAIITQVAAVLGDPVVDHLTLRVRRDDVDDDTLIELDRVLENGTSFVAWTPFRTWSDPRPLFDQGWHLWRSIDAVDWNHSERLVSPEDRGDAVIATYRTRLPIEASWGVARLLLDALGATREKPLTLITEECDEVEAQRRLHVLEQVAGAATPRPRGRRRPFVKYCLVCGQPLSDPTSVARGIGPECYDRMGGTPAARLMDLPPAQRRYRLGSKKLRTWRQSVKNRMAREGQLPTDR